MEFTSHEISIVFMKMKENANFYEMQVVCHLLEKSEIEQWKKKKCMSNQIYEWMSNREVKINIRG